jgi:type III secretory pathway component EscS
MRAQFVWQASSWLVQLLRHDTLAVALLVVVAAPVGAVPGTTQALWQLAACELQFIMQLVVVELCASRIVLLLPTAEAAVVNAPTANRDRTTLRLRTLASSPTVGGEAG